MIEQTTPSPDSGTRRYVRHMDLMVLGPLEAVEDGRPLPLGGLKQRTVLALLIANRGRPVSTDALINGVYGEDAPSGARRSVQTYVSNLRSQLGDVIRSTGSGYKLDPDTATVDAAAFERLVGDEDSGDPDAVAQRLRDALGMWRGLPYADVDGFGAIPSEVSRLNELRLVAVERRVDADMAAGRHADVVAELDSLTNEYPFRESFQSQHMLALYRSGRQAEALRAFEKARLYLVEEMGLDPSPELRDLERRILEQDPSLGYQPAPTIRRAAVLVADINDPASLAGTDPHDRVRLVDGHADALASAIDAHGGHAFAQRATAIYAWFDSVASAVNAAEEAQWSLAEMDDDKLRSRIAIDVGDVERAGGDAAQGPPVSRAAALLACARGGHVLLAPAAHAELTAGGGEWEIRGLGTAVIDGMEQEIPVHLLHGGWPMGDASLSDTAIAPAPPDRSWAIPGYEWREKVGEGAFGVVHRAYQPSVGREVAIKRIRPKMADHPSFIRRFEVEAQLVARLEHPHIVPLYDFWRDSEGAFLVMRWMRGGSLEQQLRRDSLGTPEATKLLSQVGTALAVAHRRGVVHRDIRPENVLADEEGNWYLSDFGVALIDPPTDGIEKDVADLGKVLVRCLPAGDERATAVAENAAGGRYADVEVLLADWDAATGGGISAAPPERTDARNPYKGLDSFGELDTEDFYGRDALVGQLIATAADRRLTAVVGPSGIGKSSVVRAGLIPAVRNGAIPGSQTWLITDMVPTSYPYEQLASALERIATRAPADLEERLRADSRGLLRATQRYLPQDTTLLLVIDQFEELFTMVGDEVERTAFLDLLAESADDSHSAVRILLTIRADFFDRPLRYASFGRLLRSGTVNASAPTNEELREIIVKPAAAVGAGFEPGLVDRIISDVGDQPGTLPLLEFALTRLFEHRSADVITGGDYDRVGGVRAALGRRAEKVLGTYSAVERDVARQVFLRLVNVSESGRSTRRRTRMTELNRLGYSPPELHAIVDPLVDSRLLTLDRDPITRGPTIEVAHEALLTEWPRLAEWIESQQEDLLLHSRLAAAVGDWEAAERGGHYLLQSGRLQQHEAWTAHTELSLTTAEREFLELSRSAEDERRANQSRLRRRVMAGFGIAAVLTSVLAVLALLSKSNADEQASIAEAQRLLASATAVMDEDPQLALLLALSGIGDGIPEAAGLTVLRETMAANRVVATYAWEDDEVGETRADISPDGSLVAIGADPASHVFVIDSAHGEELWRFAVTSDDGQSLHTTPHFLANEELLVTVGAEDPVEAGVQDQVGMYVLDSQSGAILRRFEIAECGAELAPGGVGGSYALVRTVSEGNLAEFGCGATETGFIHHDVMTVDLDTGVTTTLATDQPDVFSEFTAAISADGSTAAVFTPLERVEIIDLVSGEPRAELPLDNTSVLALSPDGSFVVFGGTGAENGAVLLVHDAATGERISTIAGHPGGTRGAAFSADGAVLATAGADGAVRIWNPTVGALLSEVLAGASSKTQVGFTDDGTQLVIAGPSPDVHYASLNPEINAELGSYDLCGGPGGFYQSYGLRRQQGLASVTVGCGGPLVGYIIDLASGDLIGESESTWGLGIDLSADGRFVASQDSWVTDDGEFWFGSVVVKDLETGELTEMEGLCEFDVDDLSPASCATFPEIPFPLVNHDIRFSPDGTLVAAVEENIAAGVVWEIGSRDPVHLFEGTGFAFSPSSDRLLTVNDDRLELRRIPGFEVVAERRLAARDAELANLEFTPDGLLVTGASFGVEGSGDVIVLDASTLEEVGRISGPHDGAVRDLAVSDDGTMIASAGSDGYASVWMLATGDPVMRIPVDLDGRVQVVAFADGDSRLLAAPVNGPLLAYSLVPDEVVTISKSRLLRGFTDIECATYFPNGGCPTLDEIGDP